MVQLLMPDSAESCYDELPFLLGWGGGVRVWVGLNITGKVSVTRQPINILGNLFRQYLLFYYYDLATV